MLFGYKKYKITGSEFSKLYKLISDYKIPVRNMTEKKDFLYITLSAEYCKQFEKLCIKNNYEFKVKSIKNLLKLITIVKGRPGLIIGTLIAIAGLTYLSNIAIDIKVLSDDKTICTKIYDKLNEQGINAGVYIPSINYNVVERELRKSIDEISWAGITRKGSVLMIDVVPNIEKPKSKKNRLPSNIIAVENAVIEKIETDDGQVLLGPKCGVIKGEKIVSGKIETVKTDWVNGIEKSETKTQYARCNGKAYGTFERVITVSQSYDNKKITNTGKQKNLHYIKFFSVNIPLFFSKPNGYFKSETSCEPINVFGIKLPISLKNCHISEYDFKPNKLSYEEAKEQLETKVYKYEKNFLKDYDICNRKVDIKKDKNGITETVTYQLYGIISKEVEFFIGK